MKVLLVEDSQSLQRSLSVGLRNSGMLVDQAFDGNEARAFMEIGGYDAIVLDLMIPGIDGLSLLKGMRRQGDETHVLILSARDGVDERIAGLDAGADDYLVKPFSFEELMSRLRAILRRNRQNPGMKMLDDRLYHGTLVLDTAMRTVSVADAELVLTPSEIRLLEVLLRHQGRLFSHEQLINRVYSIEREVTPNALEAHISTLRRKLRSAGLPNLIETRRGFGYLIPPLDNPSSQWNG